MLRSCGSSPAAGLSREPGVCFHLCQTSASHQSSPTAAHISKWAQAVSPHCLKWSRGLKYLHISFRLRSCVCSVDDEEGSLVHIWQHLNEELMMNLSWIHSELLTSSIHSETVEKFLGRWEQSWQFKDTKVTVFSLYNTNATQSVLNWPKTRKTKEKNKRKIFFFC